MPVIQDTDPAISVLIPAYNAEPYVAEALDSVLSQTLKPAEIVVFDDGSSDGTYERLCTYGDRIRLLGPERKGLAHARNYLLEQARYPWIAFQDADDIWLSNKLEKQGAWLQAHPEYEGCLGLAEQFLEPGCTFPPSYRKSLLEEPSAQLFIPNLLVNRMVFDRVGQFEDLGAGTESDWFMRAKDAGISFGVVPEVLFKRRWHDTNTTHVLRFENRLLLQSLRRSLHRKRQHD